MFIQKSYFDIFFSFNPNRVMGINGGYFPAICRVCFFYLSDFLISVANIEIGRSRLRGEGAENNWFDERVRESYRRLAALFIRFFKRER